MFYYSFIQSINDITNNDNQSLQKNIDVNNVGVFSWFTRRTSATQ